MIPDDEILQSQFPEVLKEVKDNEARRDALQAKFDEVNELEDDVWNERRLRSMANKELKEHKDSIKELKGERKEADKNIVAAQTIKSQRKSIEKTARTGRRSCHFDQGSRKTACRSATIGCTA